MSTIQVTHLTFGYDDAAVNVFEDVSFHIDTSWRLGLVARNGKGKTTLLRLLAAQLEDDGAIRMPLPPCYFPFLAPDAKGSAGELAQELQPERWRIECELNQLELGEEVLEKDYACLSKGEQVKVQLAILFSLDSFYLLIDEPTNHLDQQGRACVARYLKRKRGFLLVSHDRRFLDDCIDHVMAIETSGVYFERGNFSSWWQNRNRRLQDEQSRNDQLKKEIAQMQIVKQKTASWSFQVEASKYHHGKKGDKLDRGYIGHQAAKMMKRSKGIEKRMERGIEERKGLLRDKEELEILKLHPLTPSREVVAWAKDITLGYGRQEVLQKVSFEIRRGRRTALLGANGCGKSTLLQLLLGKMEVWEGSFVMERNLKISYVPQDSNFLRGRLEAFCADRQIDETLFKSILRKLDFDRELFERGMETYSEGQRKKVLLAASLSEQAHLYLWDEPFNYIDVFSRIQLEELLERQLLTLVFVEHDAAFCERFAQERIAW